MSTLEQFDALIGVIGQIGALLKRIEPSVIFPIITVALLVLFFLYYKRASGPLAGTTEWVTFHLDRPKRFNLLSRHPMKKDDAAPLIVIVVVFLILAFWILGDTAAPQSFYQFTKDDNQVTIDLGKEEELSSLMFYTGLWTGHYKLEFSGEDRNWVEQKIEEDTTDTDEAKESESPSPAMDQPHSHLFKWRSAVLNDDRSSVRFIRITASRTPLELGELAIRTKNGKLISGTDISSPQAPELFDEQELIPKTATHMNSMYFDEIYHGRTAYEFLRGVYPYETTHPPLGKEFISLSVAVFGMTPFGWRFIGAILGVLMLVIIYILLKNMFGKTLIATCGTLLFGFDFMRYTQTRIATIDTYAVLFILLAYLFMYRYLTNSPDAPFRKTVASLALSGLFFAIGCASKWVVVYAGIGLAVIYAIRLVLLNKYYDENNISGYRNYLLKTLLWSVVFFIIVPVVIYCLSYIPYGLAKDMTIPGGMLWDAEYYKIIWQNQVSMLSYHGKLVATHPYAAKWWQWVFDIRPILYFNTYSGNMRSSFAAFGNPAVWWGGLLAMIAMAYRAIRHRDGKALFILIGYLSQILPWVAVSRVLFIYHYFPSTVFLVLSLAHVFNTILEKERGRYKQAVLGYTAATGVLFVMFFPALSGLSAHQWYFKYFLKWIPGSWPM